MLDLVFMPVTAGLGGLATLNLALDSRHNTTGEYVLPVTLFALTPTFLVSAIVGFFRVSRCRGALAGES